MAKLKTPANAVISKNPKLNPLSSSSSGKKGKIAAPPKRSPEIKHDELESIAAIIAGAGLGAKEEEDVKDLADAVKNKGKSAGSTPRKKK